MHKCDCPKHIAKRERKRRARDFAKFKVGYLSARGIDPRDILGGDRGELPLHRTEVGYPNCATCEGGGCPDCTDSANP